MSRATLLYRAYAGFFLLALALTIVVLLTDTNLRTNFGTVGGYFLHWWAILAIGVADAIGAALLLLLGSRVAVKGGCLPALGLSTEILPHDPSVGTLRQPSADWGVVSAGMV